MFAESPALLWPDKLSATEAEEMLTSIGFSDWEIAWKRLQETCPDEESREILAESLPYLLQALADAATPDGSLINFERYAQSVPDRVVLFRYLASYPRAVEILIRLFVGSQFLTEILLRNPSYLEKLTASRQLADFKNRMQFYHEGRELAEQESTLPAKFDALRRFQHWELLRLGACDSFGLMDLKSVTVQLSLLADSLVQSCMDYIADDLGLDTSGFVVLGFGKLGGEELNYSSDIDLVFLSESDSTKFWPLGQRLIKALMEPTRDGFLYRVDMRLRPWGSSGALVNTVDAHVKYLEQHGMLWEKQALLKARAIAGARDVGLEFLKRAEPLMFESSVDALRANVREMKTENRTCTRKERARLGRSEIGTRLYS